MRDPLFDVIPGYEDAIKRESKIRAFAFLDLPELIGNVRVKAFTPRHFAFLELRNSPFLSGENITIEDVLFFVWVVSEDFDYNNPEGRKALVDKIIGECDINDLVKDCYTYLEDSFYDNLNKVSDTVSKAPYYSWVTSIVDMIAREYHWSESEILDIPFRRLNQYLKCIVLHNNPNATMFNPSDKVKSEWLANLMASHGR